MSMNGLHLSTTCLKQSENFVFNNYFGKFRSDIFPILQGEVLDLVFDFTDEDFNKIEEHERKDRMDRRIYEFFFFRYVRLLDNELSQVSKQTPLGELGSRIEDKIGQMMSKQVKGDNPLEFLSGDYSGFVKSIAQIGQKMGYRPKISRRSFWAGHPAASLPKNVRF